ncbi:LodA/GoxA family CTQ-dependent oxidase [Streptomyces inhibens]|uniref:LodA/GoxA family CTQ-dependent oxidase n=1 Tax=Streptomyces inhibens TaxID=2293571 RepID=UPI001EE718D1|nr:LodA/GoxA family CTQ-dependent oxidase [Streptomyces inhibens]UKY47524.1 LodA/GoxA family CTQ-dependent oxidase [Streptomyces inhibens]
MDKQIAQVKIHPAIGIARVGNSGNEPFIGPESPDEPPLPPGSYKDSSGKVIRQAARFRVYGYNKAGQVVRELKLGEEGVTEIKWSVHLANKKAAWYQFHIPLDIPEAAGLQDDQRHRRNLDIKDAARKKLVNDPGIQTIHASKHETATFAGKIMDLPVPLGSASTQNDGRLLVVGGVGKSASFARPEKPISGVANNDTWYDDVSDGPVTAEVTIGGATKTASPAWVVVGPPHYAPGVKTVRTLYDLLHDVFVTEQTLPVEPTVSYPDHIEPLLTRFCDLQWVNHGFATQFGWNGPHHFRDPAMRKRLADPGKASRELRRQVYVQMRDYARDGMSPVPWPWLYGDAMSSRPNSVRQHITLSATQDRMLALWADGHFTSGPPRTGHPNVDQAPPAEQPGLLDRAALENCAADAFHPGCEVTWPMRHKTMYSEPFRILHRTPENPERDYGDVLSLQDALGKNGPLFAQGPGDLTRWMAAPWQCDTASCRSGYEVRAGLGPRYSPYLPTFWPAQMPNHVLKKADFTTVNTKPTGGSDDSAREKAFENRAVWLRGLNGTDFNMQRRQMIDDWYKFGIVETHEYTVGDGKFPKYIQVESDPGYPPAPDDANLINIHVPEAGVPQLAAAAGTWTGSIPAESVEADLVQQAVQEIKEATGRDEAAIAAGYLEKLDPLHGTQ